MAGPGALRRHPVCMSNATLHRSIRSVYFRWGSIPFWAVHVGALVGLLVVGFSWWGLALALGLYFGRMFFLTAGYHRYFSHRSFKTSRFFQFVLALGGQTCAQMGPLWWAANHRHHHKHSDEPGDLHSVRQDGFWWSHLGWHMAGGHTGTDLAKIADFARYPELRWLNKRSVGLLPAIALGVICGLFGGLPGVVWFLVSTVLLWHGTFTINSLAHMIGRRRFATTDDSRNSAVLALITCGEGWHNNHHHYQSSVRQGFRWWELDPTYYILRGLAALGIVWGLREPPPAMLGRKAAQNATAGEAIASKPAVI